MLDPLDRHSRDSTLFQFTTNCLRDCIDCKRLLIQIDERIDFARLVEPLEYHYCRDNGRPAIHSEVLVRLCSSPLYNITSFRRLCSTISENIAFRWFCFLTIDEKVFDHCTISYFTEWVDNEGSKQMFHCFNEEPLRLGLRDFRSNVDRYAKVCAPGVLADSRQAAKDPVSCSRHGYRHPRVLAERVVSQSIGVKPGDTIGRPGAMRPAGW